MGRIVFITQTYRPDSTILGVTRDWVGALAARCDGVDVIALSGAPERGDSKVRVHDLGKDRGRGRAAQVGAFYRALASSLRDATAVFVHMVPRYAVLAAPLARLAGRPVALWYAQGGRSGALSLSTHLVDHLLTPTRDSFPLAGAAVERRLRVTGHGVDVRRYAPGRADVPEPGRVLAAGRLSPSKRYDFMLKALARVEYVGWRLRIASGEGYTADDAYAEHVRREIARLDLGESVKLLGAVSYETMPSEYRAAWLSAHTSATGSLDKVVLESMACGTPVVSTAPSSRSLLEPIEKTLAATDASAESLAAALDVGLGWSPTHRDDVGEALRRAVERDHSLEGWADRVAALLVR